METVRLKAIRQPPHVERLLERLVTQAGLVPADAGAPVLTVTKYSEQGSLQEAGQWTVDRKGNWRRCAD